MQSFPIVAREKKQNAIRHTISKIEMSLLYIKYIAKVSKHEYGSHSIFEVMVYVTKNKHAKPYILISLEYVVATRKKYNCLKFPNTLYATVKFDVTN